MSRQCPALRRPGAHCSSRDKAPPQHRRDNLLAVDIAPCLATASASGEEGRRPSPQDGLSNQLSNDGYLTQQSGMDAHGRLRRSTSPARRVLKLLRDKEVTATVAATVSSCLTIWPGSTCRVNTLSIRRANTSPSPCSPIYGTPRLRATWRHWQPSMRGSLSSHLFVPRDIRSSASRFFRWASGNAWGTSASSGSGGDPSCPSPTADLLDGSRHFVDHWSRGRSCVRSTSAGVSSAKQCGYGPWPRSSTRIGNRSRSISSTRSSDGSRSA
jgi:hypothetical protein